MERILARLLVAVDESPAADRAVAMSLALAARHGSELIFCTAIDHAAVIAQCAVPQGSNDPTPVLEALDAGARSLLREVESRARASGITKTSTALLDGAPAAAIVAHAVLTSADAIVMGTQGKGGLELFFLGSTAEGVLRAAHVPTLVVHPSDASPAQPFAVILVATDESEPARAAATFARALAAAEGGQVTLCNAVQKRGAGAATASGIAGGVLVVEGEPVEALTAVATARHADVLVVGTHGRHGLTRLLLGSVAAGLVRRGALPVFVVPAVSA